MRIPIGPRSWTVLLVGAVFGAISCSGGGDPVEPPDPPRPTTISIATPSFSFDAIGATEQITVTIRDQNGQSMSGVSVTYISNNSNAVSVSGSGLVTAVGNGTAMISVQAGSLSATVNVTVMQLAVAPQILGGDGQSAGAGGLLPVALQVKAQDRLGNALQGKAVTFAVTKGGGSVAPATAITGIDGVASAAWTLGTVAGGEQEVSASVEGQATPTTFTATVLAGPPATMAVHAGDNQTATVGSPVGTPPAVIIKDFFGNPVKDVGVLFAVTGGGGSVTGASAMTNDAGVATVGSWVLGDAPGANGLSASSGSLAPVALMATALVGPPANVTVSGGDNQTATIASPVTVPPSVLVTDALGNPVADVTVTFAVTGGGGNVAGATPQTNGNGIAAVGSWTLGPTAGPNALSATVASLAPATFSATAVAPPAAIVVFAGNNQVAAAGSEVPVPPAVRVTDALGNPSVGVAVAFQITGGGGSLEMAAAGASGFLVNATLISAETDGNGVAAAESWTLGTTAGPNSVSATVIGLPPANFAATGVAGQAAAVAINTGNNQTATVSTPVPVPPSVIVRDQHSNPVSGATVTFLVASGGGFVTSGVVQTNPQGVAAVGGWTLGPSAGTNTMTATVTGAAIAGNPVTFTATGTVAPLPGLNIEVRFLVGADVVGGPQASGQAPTPAQEAAFNNAAARLAAIVTHDLPSVPFSTGAGSCGANAPAINETIDDLVIFATLEPIDGVGMILGSAGPCWLRGGSLLPFIGRMRFDVADLAALESSGLLEPVILHEMLHVLGVGSLWDLLGLLVNPSLTMGAGVDTHLTGVQSVAAFNAIGGTTYTGGAKVPVHNDAVSGRADAHWRESVLLSELMTPFVDTSNPLSRLTIASLQDLGYVVDLDQADPFGIMPTFVLGPDKAAHRFELVKDVERLPLGVVDSKGRVIRVIPR
ncbi:MAG TPA: Ig-like domain-containing protein [Gemmatimonadaceae bacterium]